MMTERKKVVRLIEGQVLRIDLKDGTHAYARTLKRPLIAFYNGLYRDNQELPIDEIVALPIAFKIDVMNYVVTKGIWPVIGRVPLTPELKETPRFFKQDMMNGQLAIYQEVPDLAPSYERPATYEECLGLEVAAVWDPEHVEERLRDYFAGRACKWIDRVRTPEEFRAWQEEMHRKREANRPSLPKTLIRPDAKADKGTTH